MFSHIIDFHIIKNDGILYDMPVLLVLGDAILLRVFCVGKRKLTKLELSDEQKLEFVF